MGTPRPGTEVSRALQARNPERVRKESERVSRHGEPQSPQRVRHGVRKESTNSPKLRFWTLFGLRGALFGDSGASRGGTPFRTLFGLFWGSGPEGPGRPLCLVGVFPKLVFKISYRRMFVSACLEFLHLFAIMLASHEGSASHPQEASQTSRGFMAILSCLHSCFDSGRALAHFD